MSRYYQVPHHATGWLLLSAVWAVLPILWRGPVSMLLVVLLLLGWRWQIARGRLAMPGRLLRFGLLLLLVLLTLWHYHTIFGPDAGVALLAATFTLKLLEMFRLRDAYVVLLLGYFVLAMVFLFEQGPLITLYVLAGFMLLTAALVGINQADDKGRALAHLRQSSLMVMKAIPLMLVIFVVVPRVAPLWGFKLDTDQAKTGLSDSMAPGDISDISQSAEPVFRVEFQGQVPPPAQRYWRGLTYSWFDGERWRQAATSDWQKDSVQYPGRQSLPWYAALEKEKTGKTPDYRYRVLLEPTGRRWLFALDVPFSDTADVGLARDFRLVNRRPVDKAMAYRVTSYSHLTLDAHLPAELRRLDLALPPDGNPRTRSLARQWRAQSGSDADYIRRVLGWFHDQPFFYTLHPPKMPGRNSIDNFLFESRRGFCAHYASAFTFLMRAAGIPARVVAGYQGGTINPMGNYLQVRQYDAHAWVEVWLDGRGWVRQDPTAAVAPERIEDGILAALDDGDAPSGAGGIDYWATGSLLGRLGMLGDYVNYLWQRWVLNYDESSQRTLFANWFAGINFYRLLSMAVLAVLALALALFAWGRWQARRHLTAWQWQYLKLRRALAKRGVAVSAGQTPKQLIIQACIALPEKRQQLLAWLAAYQALAYANCPPDETSQRFKQLKRSYPF